MKVKVYVVTIMFRRDDTVLRVEGVYSTKTRAKEKLAELREKTLDEYKDEYDEDEYEIGTDIPTLFEITHTEEEIWDEILVTEKVIDADDDN